MQAATRNRACRAAGDISGACNDSANRSPRTRLAGRDPDILVIAEAVGRETLTFRHIDDLQDHKSMRDEWQFCCGGWFCRSHFCAIDLGVIMTLPSCIGRAASRRAKRWCLANGSFRNGDRTQPVLARGHIDWHRGSPPVHWWDRHRRRRSRMAYLIERGSGDAEYAKDRFELRRGNRFLLNVPCSLRPRLVMSPPRSSPVRHGLCRLRPWQPSSPAKCERLPFSPIRFDAPRAIA